MYGTVQNNYEPACYCRACLMIFIWLSLKTLQRLINKSQILITHKLLSLIYSLNDWLKVSYH